MTLIKVKSRGTDNVSGRRNLIINGDMKIAQRKGTAVTQAPHNGYAGPDRWKTFASGGGAYTITQDSGHQAATGHDKALKLAVTTADTSVASSDVYSFLTRIESNSLQHLQYGTSSAKSITFSFWVRATKTGTQAIFFSKQGTGTDYNHIKEFTINASNTWEHKTITIPGLTASTMVNDASTYLQVGWILVYGSDYHGTKDSWRTDSDFTTSAAVNNMDSTSNTFYVTGVQLEVGDSASDFEHRSFAEEFALCERYFFTTYNYGATIGASSTASYLGRFLDNKHSYGSLQVPTVAMRGSPTRVIYNPVNGTVGQVRSDSNNHSANITGTDVKGGGWIYANASVIGTSVSMKAHLTMDAEL